MQLVTNYMKNITKSVAYAAADIGKQELIPNVASFSETNKDFLKNAYAALKNPTVAVQKGIDSLKESKVYQALDYGTKNIFEDLRTGKFYNKEREERDQLKLAGLDADGWDDLSEFGIDDDWENNINKSNQDQTVTKGDLQIVGAIESSNAAAANATVNAIITTSKHSVQNSRVNTSLLYQQNERLFSGLHTDMSILNATMDSIFKLTSSTLQNLDKNTSGFFTESLKLDAERNAMMKELLEMERNKYKTAIQKEQEAANKAKKKMRWSDINIEGLPDFDAYFKNVMQNFSNQIQNTVGFSGMGEDSNMLATFMISPLKFIPEMLVKGIIPSTVKLATQELDKTLTGVFSTVIGKLGNARADGDNGILGLLGKLFGVNTGVNRNIDNSKYEKGAVPFDGITRKAIIDVIPSHLRRIEAALTGSEEMMYDYHTGKWVKPRDVRRQYQDIKKSSVKGATNDLRQNMDKYRKRIKSSNFEENEEFDKALDEFQEFLYENNGVFNPNVSAQKNGIDFRYRYLSKYYKPIVEIFNNFDTAVDKNGKKFHTNYSSRLISKKVLEAKDREEKIYRDIETDPTNIIYQLMGSPEANKHLSEIKSNGKGTGNFKIAHNMLLDTKDKLDNTIFDYLQMTVKELQWQRLNAGMFGGKNSNSGATYNGKPISIDDIKLPSKKTTNSSYLKGDNQSLKDIVKKIESGEAIDLAWMQQDEQNALLALRNAIDNDAIKEYDEYVKDIVNNSGAFAKWMDKNFYKTSIRTQEDLDNLNKSKDDKDKDDENKKEPNFFKKAADKLSKFTEAPAEIFTNLLYSADKAIYEMFFKMEINDEEKGNYNGFVDFLAKKTEKTFDKLKTNINENILEPLKKKLGIGDEFKNKFKQSLTDDLTSIGNFFINSNKDVYNEIKGFVKKPSDIVNQSKKTSRDNASFNINKVSSIDNLLDDSYREMLRNNGLNPLDYTSKEESDKDLLPLLYKSLLDKSNYTESFRDEAQLQQMFKAIRQLPEKDRLKFLEKAASQLNIKLKGKDIEELTNDFEKKRIDIINSDEEEQSVDKGQFGGSWLDGMAAGTLGKPFSGNTMLSKGELLFNEDGIARVKKTDAYRLDKPTHILNSVDSSILMGEKPTTTIEDDLKKENSIKDRILANHADGTTTLKLNGQDIDVKPYIDEAKKFAPESLAGGAIGGIASTLFGLVGGPLLGAGLGAATGFILKSDLVKNKLFGKLGEDGQRKGGIINKTVVDAVKHYAPGMLKYGAAGIIPGLLTPLGPIGGLLIGGAIGFLKNNEKMSNKLYGDTDNILGVNEKTKKVLKDMIPGAGKGAAVGAIASVLFGGPFGLLGNAALGAGVGIMTSTEEFKDGILGKELNGVRMGGILGMLKTSFQPLADAALEIKDEFLKIIDKNIVDPIKRFLTPTIHAIPQFAGFIVGKINEKLEEKFTKPLTSMLKDKFLDPLVKVTSKVLKPIVTVPANIITAPFKMLGTVGDKIKKTQMKTHNADYMTAEERNAERERLGMKQDNLDIALANIGKEGGLSVGDARNLRNNVLSIVDNTKDVTKAKKSSVRDINNIIDNYTTEDGKTLLPKAKDKLRKALYKGDIKTAQNILARYKLNGSNRTLTEKEIDTLLNGKDENDKSLSDHMNKYIDLHNRENQTKNMTSETRDSVKLSVVNLMEQLGYDVSKGISNNELTKFAKMLDTEITRNEANPDQIGKELALETEQTGYLKLLVENTSELKDFIKSLVTGNSDIIKKYNEGTANDFDQAQQDIASLYKNRKQEIKDTIGEEEYDDLSDSAIDVMTSATAGKFRSKAKNQNAVLKQVKKGKLATSEIDSTNGGSNLKRIAVLKDYGYKLNNEAIKLITSCTDTAFKNVKTVLKNKYVRLMAQGREITIDDIKLIIGMTTGKPEFCRRCKILIKAGKTSKDYKTFESIVKESATTITILKSNAETAEIIQNAKNEKEQTENTEDIAKNGIGTFLFGLAKKGIGSLFGSGESEDDGASKANAAASAINSLTNSIKSTDSTPINSSLDEVDKQGDNKDQVVTGDGTVLTIKKGSDGSSEADLSDPATKKFFNIKNQKDKIMEKLQNAQLTASEKINSVFEGADKIKKSAKNGMNIISYLLFGGLLWKSGILTKIWDNTIKPLWKDRIKPWLDTTVVPWVLDTAIPTATNLIGSAIQSGAEFIVSNLPGILKSVFGAFLGLEDTIVGNPTNVGGTTTIDPTGKTGQTEMYDESGNALTYEDIQNKNFEKIYNVDGVEGYINEDGTISFDDPSFRGSGYLKVVGNGAAHAFAQGGAGLLTKGVDKAASFTFKHGGLTGKIAGGALKGITAPIKAAGNLGEKAAGKVGQKVVNKAVANGILEAAPEVTEKAAKNGNIVSKTANAIGKAANGVSSYIGDTKALASLAADYGDEAFELADNKAQVFGAKVINSKAGQAVGKASSKVITKAGNWLNSGRELNNLAKAGYSNLAGEAGKSQKIAGKIAGAVDSVKGLTKNASSGKSSGFLNKIITKAKGFIDDLLANSTVLRKIKDAAEVLGHSDIGKFVSKLKTHLDDIFTSALTKGCKEAGEATITKAASKLCIIATVVFAIKDFIWGCDQAESILGVTDTTIIEELVCGLVNALCNLLVLPAIIPGVSWCAEKLLGFFVKDLEERQAEAEAEYQAWKSTVTGSTATKEEYLKEKYSATGKIGKGIKGFGKKIKDGFGNIKDKAGELKDAAVDKIKSAAGSVADFASGVVDKAKKTGSNILDLGKILGKYVSAGDILGLMGYNSGAEGTETYEGQLNKSAVGIFKLGAFIPTVVSAIAHKIADGIGFIIDKVKTIGSATADTVWTMKDYMLSGDITGLMNHQQAQSDNELANSTSSIVSKIGKVVMFVPTVVSAGVHKVAQGIGFIIDKVKTIGSATADTVWTMKDYMLSGDISGLMNHQQAQSDNELANATSSAVSKVGKVAMFVPTVVSAGMHKVAQGIGFVIDKVKTVGSSTADTVWTMKDYMLSGDISGLMNHEPQQSDNQLANATSSAVSKVGKVAMFVPTVVSAGVHKIAEAIGTVINSARQIGSTVINSGGELFGMAKRGDIEGMSNYTIGEGEGPIHKVGEVVTGIEKVVLSPVAYISKGIGTVKDAIAKVATSITNVKDETTTVIDNAKSGKFSVFSSKYWSVTTKETGIAGTIGKLYGYISRLSNAPMVLVSSIFSKVADAFDNVKEWLGEKFEGVVEFFEDPLAFIYEKITGDEAGSGTGTFVKKEDDDDDDDGSGTSRYGRGNNGRYAKQIDPAVSSMRYNAKGDTEYQTIGDSACGPVAAVNAVKYAYGRGNNKDEVVSATNYALNNGYKEHNGGTTPRFFTDYFNKNGLSSNITKNKTEIANSITSGNATVLMGKDPNGTSNSSPFGRNSHYVTATGMDANGRVIVQDPESKYDNQLYDLNDLLSRTTLAVSAYGKGTRRVTPSSFPRIHYGRGKYGRGDVAAQVWYFLRNNGFTEEATAGLMGNFKQESDMNPACIQGNGRGPAAGLFQMENYNTKSDRWAEMAAYAKSKGKDWTDLQSQLEYLIMTMDSQFKAYTGKEHTYSNGTKAWWPKKMTAAEFKALTSISEATEIFERVYERASKPMMEKRIKYANDYYKQFTGKSGEAIGSSSASTANASTTKKFQLSDIGTMLGNYLSGTKAGKALTLLSGITNDTANNGNSNYGPASGDAAALINAAAADIGYKESGNNITKFGEWYGMNGQPWCAMFVSHAANKAGISTDVIPKYSYCPTGYDWFKSRGQTVSGSEAKAGDIVFFKNSDRMYHTGIVEDVSNGEIHTIEGNSSDMVKRRTYSTSDSKLYFGRPKYANTSGTTTTSNGQYAAMSDAPDIANTRGGNCCKPVSKYGVFKDNICGRGKLSSSKTNNSSIVEMNSSLVNTGKPINVKTKSGSFNRVEDTSGTGSHGRGDIDYTKLLNVILTTLVTIADNTDKLNAVVDILNEKLGLDVKPTQSNPESIKSKLKKILLNSKDTSLNTYMDTMNSQSMYNIINAMNAIASE